SFAKKVTMNRNQKIAIGCGAAGCLGLIVLVVVCVVLFLVFGSSTNSNRRGNINRNSSNSNSNSNSNSSDSEPSSSSSISDDDKHKLFQAAGAAQDADLMKKVLEKLGFIHADGSQTAEYADFLKDHLGWALKNVEFIQTVNTPEKGRAYVEAH